VIHNFIHVLVGTGSDLKSIDAQELYPALWGRIIDENICDIHVPGYGKEGSGVVVGVAFLSIPQSKDSCKCSPCNDSPIVCIKWP